MHRIKGTASTVGQLVLAGFCTGLATAAGASVWRRLEPAIDEKIHDHKLRKHKIIKFK